MLGRLSPILVVDGCAASGQTTHRYLRSLGHQIIDYAPDGRTASRLIGRKNYRLILADGDVAPADGFDLLRETRTDQRYQYLPFLMAITIWKKKFIEIVREDGATLYITKPFKVDTLGERMAQVYGDANRLKDAHARAAYAAADRTRAPDVIPDLWRQLRPLP